ncbi:MAG: recombinase family protein [Bryobacteraceae bacterium]
MARKERIHEPIAGLVQPDYLEQRIKAGWRLVGLEWERDAVEAAPSKPQGWVEEIPYGLQVSDDCTQLVANPAEVEVIVLALDMIVEDCRLSRVAEEVNRRGYRTRLGDPWTPTALFNLLPRMIAVGPRVFNSEEWMTRRERLPKVV